MKTTKSKWPNWAKKLVKWLAKVVLHVDIDANRKKMAAKQLQLDVLWAAGVRVRSAYGVSGGVLVETPEWIDFDLALNDVSRLEAPTVETVPA